MQQPYTVEAKNFVNYLKHTPRYASNYDAKHIKSLFTVLREKETYYKNNVTK